MAQTDASLRLSRYRTHTRARAYNFGLADFFRRAVNELARNRISGGAGRLGCYAVSVAISALWCAVVGVFFLWGVYYGYEENFNVVTFANLINFFFFFYTTFVNENTYALILTYKKLYESMKNIMFLGSTIFSFDKKQTKLTLTREFVINKLEIASKK